MMIDEKKFKIDSFSDFFIFARFQQNRCDKLDLISLITIFFCSNIAIHFYFTQLKSANVEKLA